MALHRATAFVCSVVYFCRRRLCFHFGLFVCLSVCPSDNWKSCERISWRDRAWPGDQWVQFWWQSGSPYGSRSPKSEIRIHWIIESYQRILIKFYGELGCGLETNFYILVTIRITIRIRESVIWEELPQFYYAGIRRGLYSLVLLVTTVSDHSDWHACMLCVHCNKESRPCAFGRKSS